ncbi:hypothetical protein [Providencia rettgeri]|uniref:hypothetical protein n=1 Tax=Providencia rettgeri TaxID=587 RepID=UPI00226E90AB|nr:hypothetical protein [Providencia rettgeri]MCX9118797.1 hypothetical protein [Providencia rettgeri]
MSDKKEIATLSIKISVDSTDLDKLEAQLKRIEGLMVSSGLKQPASGGFVTDPYFGINDGKVFINSAFITSTTFNDAMKKAAKERAAKGAGEAMVKITMGVNYNDDLQHTVSVASFDGVARAIKARDEAFEKNIKEVIIKDVAQSGPLYRAMR